jgi:hypothetical protein
MKQIKVTTPVKLKDFSFGFTLYAAVTTDENEYGISVLVHAISLYPFNTSELRDFVLLPSHNINKIKDIEDTLHFEESIHLIIDRHTLTLTLQEYKALPKVFPEDLTF